MAGQQAFGGPGGVFNGGFHDPVFEPNPDFNFEDEAHHMMSNGYSQQQDFSLYDPSMHPGFPTPASETQQGQSMFSQGYWPNSFQDRFATEAGMPPSVQEQIVNDRTDSVTQFFGQITPPDTDPSGKAAKAAQQAPESDAAKRKERARNAANKRHSKTKKSRTGSESQGGDDDLTEERGERQAHYREKNRVAAAKCRAKKKSHNDNLEEMHRGEASKNKVLKAELMGLRNELAQLKSLTLEHSPDSCHCHGIHEYSMRQASLIARGAAPQYGPSPVQESPLSADTPAPDAPGEALFPPHDQMSPAMGSDLRRPSFAPGGWSQAPS